MCGSCEPILTLPVAPESAETKVHSGFSAPIQRSLSPVGVFTQHFVNREDTFSDHLQAYASHSASAAAAKAAANLSLDDDDEEEEDESLLSLDPKDWKNQDHYEVLGLSKLRYRATLDDIIKSHRKKVLRHHPDKKAAQGYLNDDGFFKCIQKAFEILTDPVKRRQWDSVDPGVSTDIPSAKEKGDFYAIYRPVFEREARFSNIQPVPELGDENSDREAVESFYQFWYNFDSWRSFEYLDKENVDGGSNRDDKRWIEGKNRKERAARKKEDIQRLLTLVDNAMKSDPRMIKFKEEDKKKRNAKRNAREEEERKAAEAKKKADEEAKKQAELELAKEEELKKQRQMNHKALKAEQRALKRIFKNANYFAAADAATVAEINSATEKQDKVIAANPDLDALVAVRTQIEAAVAAGNGLAVVDEIVSKL
ncbi:Zuotin [Coemansia erecta]|uniref:Zuotin n=1 Tax=Coemansia asiatica TaxID=1052880 RepID=A0A9W8CLK9_9FUNG|nr:Zuotin [Coemansia asiatica]KAJ2854844.1 Zuotin [Coemansia erecta]KAJ2885791.1 Zuotin [Coemansia asiatica]